MNQSTLPAFAAAMMLDAHASLATLIRRVEEQAVHIDSAIQAELDQARAILARIESRPQGEDVPKVLIAMEGGLIQHATADRAVEIMVIDYDCEGADEDDLTEVDQADDEESSERFEDACVSLPLATINPEVVRRRFSLFDSTEGARC